MQGGGLVVDLLLRLFNYVVSHAQCEDEHEDVRSADQYVEGQFDEMTGL